MFLGSLLDFNGVCSNILLQATQQVNNAAQLVAGPMVADKAYKVAKRRLQQILGTPALDTSGLANWLESGWQSQAQQLEANLASLQVSMHRRNMYLLCLDIKKTTISFL